MFHRKFSYQRLTSTKKIWTFLDVHVDHCPPICGSPAVDILQLLAYLSGHVRNSSFPTAGEPHVGNRLCNYWSKRIRPFPINFFTHCSLFWIKGWVLAEKGSCGPAPSTRLGCTILCMEQCFMQYGMAFSLGSLYLMPPTDLALPLGWLLPFLGFRWWLL